MANFMLKYKKMMKVLLVALLFFLILPITLVSAETVDDKIEPEGYSEEEIMEVHTDLDKILRKNDGFFYNDLTRKIGEWSINGLGWVLEFFERGVDTIITMGNFYEMPGVKNMIDNLMPFILGLFLLTLIIVGMLLMFNKIEKREELIVNILLAASMLVILPNIFPLLDKALNDGVDHLTYNDSLKDTVVQTNVADLQKYVDAKFEYSGKGGNLPNPSDQSNWNEANDVDGMKFAVNETFDMYEGENSFWFNDADLNDFKKDNPNAYNVLITRTDYDGKGDDTSLRLLRKNIFPGTEFGRESYYRYAINWGTIITTLLILTVATAITVIKMARVIFDIAFHSIFGLFVAVTDVTGGQRIKKMITEIVSSFAVFFVMVLILRLFIMYANWLVGMKDSVGTIAYLLMLIGGAWALLDAPDIVQRLLGIDAGLRSAWGTMAGAYGLAKGAQGVGKGISKGIDAGAKGVAGATAFGKGALGMQPKGGGGSREQRSPVNAGDLSSSSGGKTGGSLSTSRSSDGGSDGSSTSAGLHDSLDSGRNEGVVGMDDSNSIGDSPFGDGINDNSLSGDDPKKNMRFNLDAPNKPLSSGNSKGEDEKSNRSGGRKFNLDAPNKPISGSSGGLGSSGSSGKTFSTNQPNFSTGGGASDGSSGGISGGSSSSSDGSLFGGSYSSSGGSTSYGGGMETQKQAPVFASPTADSRNEFYSPTLRGSSRRGQEVAVHKAKAYNSGLKFRQNVSGAMKTGRQFKNITIASAKNSLGMEPSKKNINND